VPEKLSEAKYLGAVFAHFVYPVSKYPFVEAIKLISSTINYINGSKNLHIIRSFREFKKDKVNIILGIEGGHIFDNTLKQVEVLYELGIRVFTLTWNNSNRLAHSALEADKKGLTRKGREFIKELSNLDVILDISHASTRTVLDVCEIINTKVIASHSCLRALNSYLRNIDDQALKAIINKGGIVGINFSKKHLGDYTISEHIDYLKDNFGINSIGIGSDFDGINDAVIADPYKIKGLEKELRNKNYSTAEIEAIFSENFLRVMGS